MAKARLSREAMEMATESLKFAGAALEQSLERQKLRIARSYEVFQAKEYF